MKAKEQFGQRIKYQEILSHIVYITDGVEVIDKKLYITDSFHEVEPPKSNVLLNAFNERTKWPSAYRKIIFAEECNEGIIIGQTKRSEGKYHPSYAPSGPDYDDYEQASLEIKKTYSFWIVATEMNVTVLVPKK